MLLFLDEMKFGGNLESAYRVSKTPLKAREFVDFTFNILGSKKTYLQAAIFTFGREDLIPDMFVSIIDNIHKNFPHEISIFKYYIERHIEVDGGHHSHLALQMTANLCGDNDQLWLEAEEAVIQSLQRRIGLWDGIYNQLQKKRKN
jgi:pyrroloquinoline quinone (PQQ) biosynthesis protein C